MILGYTAGEREIFELEILAADVNLDGVLNEDDAQLILEYCVENVSELPVIY